jgi:hypothetical protein
MKPARIWLSFFLAGFAVDVVLLLVTLFTPVPYGDLSRIGRLSEGEFGWQRQPPALSESFIYAVPVEKADILVIGDSFSMTYVWQSELVRAGYRVTTIYWDNFDSTVCGDLESWLQASGFGGKAIVFESVERLLKKRLKRSNECSRMIKPFHSEETPYVPALKQKPGFAFNSDSTLANGMITQFHTWQAARTKTDKEFTYDTRVGLVENGCAQFSHRLCDRALFHQADLEDELDQTDFERLEQFNRSHASMPSIWMVIPNKTTVYQHPDRSKRFRDPFVAAGLGPDLFALAALNRFSIEDFYFPNDTHISSHGQIVLGRRMLEAVREVLPLPSRTLE